MRSFQLKKLEELGFEAFVFGIFDGNVEVEHTDSISTCFTPGFVAYLHAVLVAGKCSNACSVVIYNTNIHFAAKAPPLPKANLPLPPAGPSGFEAKISFSQVSVLGKYLNYRDRKSLAQN